MAVSSSPLDGINSGWSSYSTLCLAEKEIPNKENIQELARTLKFVYDCQRDEIQVELWGADGPNSPMSIAQSPGKKLRGILESDKIWFQYLGTPIQYQNLPSYVRNKIGSKIQDAELHYCRSKSGEISVIVVMIE